MPMKVVLKVHGHLREFFPGQAERHEVALTGPLSVAEILREQLGVDPALVMAVVAGGRRRTRDYVPADGEELVLLSPAAGG
jgi:hypothetical protein